MNKVNYTWWLLRKDTVVLKTAVQDLTEKIIYRKQAMGAVTDKTSFDLWTKNWVVKKSDPVNEIKGVAAGKE